MTLQQQIQDLAQQIAQLSAQIEQPQEKRNNAQIIDYKKLLKIAKQRQFSEHIVKNKDEHTKSLYLQMLFQVWQQAEKDSEKRLLLLACIANSMGEGHQIQHHLTKAMTFSEKDMDDFIAIITNEKLLTVFTIDLLMLSNVSTEHKLMKIVIDILAMLQISQETLLELAQFVKDLLMKNYSSILEHFDLSPNLNEDSRHYLSSIFKEVIIEESTSPFGLSKIIHPDFTEKVTVKNSKLMFDNPISWNDAYKNLSVTEELYEDEGLYGDEGFDVENGICIIQGIKQIHLENCEILNGDLCVLFYQMDEVILKNVEINSNGKLTPFDFYEVTTVHMDQVMLIDKEIDNIGRDAFIIVKECNQFICKNSIFKNNKYYLKLFYQKIFNQSFIECINTKKVKQENNQVNGNVIMEKEFFGNNFKQEKFNKFISKY